MNDVFDDLTKIIPSETEWGKWWQSAEEVHIEVNVPKGTTSKQVKIDYTNTNISVSVSGNTIFSGALFKKIKSAELLWNLEDGGSLLNILLVKMNYKSSEEPWPSLMEDSRYKLEDSMYEKLKKNLEMEKLKQQVMQRV